jgi:predicted ATPase
MNNNITEIQEEKINEAQDILLGLGLPKPQQNRICALTLLALCNIKPNDNWSDATARSLILSLDIIEFVNHYYDADYKPNTRESFRKNALKPFVENNLALLNPDDPELSPTSSKTHYAISEIALKAIQAYNTEYWDDAVEEFKKNQFPQNLPSAILLRKITIENYKSIFYDSIELGRFNVFIGVNGCGKSNILEAIATAGSSIVNDLNFEGLYSRGVRSARPNLTTSSFLSTPKKENIEIGFEFQGVTNNDNLKISLFPEDPNDIYTQWRDVNNDLSSVKEKAFPSFLKKILDEVYSENEVSSVNRSVFEHEISKFLEEKNTLIKKDSSLNSLLSNFAIFDLNTKSLRGVVPADSRKTPLGINGEGLDLLIANFNSYEKSILKECGKFFDWLDSIFSDKDDKAKSEGLKPGRSSSTLYFTDKYMQKQNNTFSAENSNEGILHVLFYIALFISNRTPNLFAIDNIETALNPRLCQKLLVMLAQIAQERGKQALITTHNPAVLDGLNLNDDEQRLFVVYRDSEGKTKTRRIKFKHDLSNKDFKLSEMWLNGSLGAIPKNF